MWLICTYQSRYKVAWTYNMTILLLHALNPLWKIARYIANQLTNIVYSSPSVHYKLLWLIEPVRPLVKLSSWWNVIIYFMMINHNRYLFFSPFYWHQDLIELPPQLMRPCWHMWQSRVEIEDYSVMYFNRIAEFKVLYRGTSVRGRTHTRYVDSLDIHASAKHVWTPSI